MDEVALPIVLAWQLRRFEPQLYQEHVKKAADFIAANGPYTPQERWENQSGWSPGTIAAEIAGLVCAADIARRNGDTASAQRWELLADEWEAQVNAWTATSNGPYDPKLLPPVHEAAAGGAAGDPDPNVGTTTRSVTAARRPPTSGAWSTRASSSWCASASSPTTTGRC